MVFKSPGDVLFNICSMPVYTYGVIIAFSCFVGVLVSYAVYKHYNPDEQYERVWDFAAWLLIFGIIGARLYYCALNPVYYSQNPLAVLNFREGGLSIHGGIIFGILVLIYFGIRYKLGVFKLLDAFACGTVLAQSIGRWGNFFNSEAFGLPTELPWKLYIPLQNRPPDYIRFSYFHPTFLYESILDIFIFFMLLYLMKYFAKRINGVVFFSYLVMYSVVRFFIEGLRIDSALNISGIPIARIISLCLFAVGVCGLIFLFVKKEYRTR